MTPETPSPERRLALARRWFALHSTLTPCAGKTADTTQDESGIWYNAPSGTTRLMTWDMVEESIGCKPCGGTGEIITESKAHDCIDCGGTGIR